MKQKGRRKALSLTEENRATFVRPFHLIYPIICPIFL